MGVFFGFFYSSLGWGWGEGPQLYFSRPSFRGASLLVNAILNRSLHCVWLLNVMAMTLALNNILDYFHLLQLSQSKVEASKTIFCKPTGGFSIQARISAMFHCNKCASQWLWIHKEFVDLYKTASWGVWFSLHRIPLHGRGKVPERECFFLSHTFTVTVGIRWEYVCEAVCPGHFCSIRER